VARRRDRLDLQTADAQRVRPDRQAELVLVRDVVVVRVRPENRDRLDPPTFSGLAKRAERRAGIDVDGPAAFLVGDEIGVREPSWIHAPCNQHVGTLPVHPRRGGRMPGLISRFSTIVKAKFSALLNRAENPNETLDYSYEKQLESLQNVKRGIADVVTAKKRLQLQTQQLEQNVVKLDTQARQALAANREDLARQALERKSGFQQQLQQLDTQVQQLESQQEKLTTNEQQLSARIEQFRSQKEVMKAQYSAAEAQVRIGEAATGIGRQMEDTGLAIQRAKDKTDQMQARASALDELVQTGGLDDLTSDQTQLDRELAQLSSQTQVDQELEKLKAEVGSGAPPKEIESSPPPPPPA
jgi:phage shock protein A